MHLKEPSSDRDRSPQPIQPAGGFAPDKLCLHFSRVGRVLTTSPTWPGQEVQICS